MMLNCSKSGGSPKDACWCDGVEWRGLPERIFKAYSECNNIEVPSKVVLMVMLKANSWTALKLSHFLCISA